MRRTLPVLLSFVLVGLPAVPAPAGVFDDIRGVVDDVGGVLDESKATKRDVEDAVADGKELVPDLPETEWHVAVGGSRKKVSEAQLRDEIASGAVGKDTLVWRKGQGDWQPAGQIGALRGYFEEAPPPLPSGDEEGPPPLPGERR